MVETTPEQEPWPPTIEDWRNINKDAASTMLALAEKRLSETLVLGENHRKRTDLLRSIVVPVFTLSAGYFLTNIAAQGKNLNLLLLSFLVAAGLVFTMYFISKNIFDAFNPAVPGAQPIKTLTSNRFNGVLSPEHQYLDLVLHQLMVYQKAIERNTRINDIMLENIRNTQLTLILLIIALLILYPLGVLILQ